MIEYTIELAPHHSEEFMVELYIKEPKEFVMSLTPSELASMIRRDKRFKDFIEIEFNIDEEA